MSEEELEENIYDELDKNEEIISAYIKRKRLFVQSIALIVLLAFLAFFASDYLIFLFSDKMDFFNENQSITELYPDIENYRSAVVSIEISSNKGGKGSGFNIKDSGLIITNYHVVKDASRIGLTFPNGQYFESSSLTHYPEIDISFINLDNDKTLPFLEINTDYFAKKGEEVFIIGSPLGFPNIGVVGTIGHYRIFNEHSVFDIKANIQKGNSGSPVINQQGQVIGVVFALANIEENGESDYRALAIAAQEIEKLSEIPSSSSD